jgi:hypothetical protein
VNVQASLKSQYHGALAMLRKAIEQCPDDLWLAGEHPRTTWRIAYHALYFTHFYLQPDVEAFRPWEGERPETPCLENTPWPPHGVPMVVEPYTRQELMAYWCLVDGMIDEGIDRLDLNAAECGFPWYRMGKLEHQIMNIRHTQQHVGQLSQILASAGADPEWEG